MNQFETLVTRIRVAVRTVHLDLLGLSLFTLVATVVLYLFPGTGPLDVVFGLPLVFFLPGYALLAALYPDHEHEADVSSRRDDRNRLRPPPRAALDTVERLAMSFGLSVALAAVIGGVLIGVHGQFTSEAYLLTLITFVSVTVAAGIVRTQSHRGQRRSTPYVRALRNFWASAFETGPRGETVLNVALILGIALTGSAMTYAVVNPANGSSYTSFAVLSENESGSLVTGNYTTNVSAERPAPLTVSITNREQRRQNYTVVVLAQRVDPRGDGLAVVEEEELTRMRATVEAGDTWRRAHVPRSELTGENVRLRYLLYRSGTPPEPRAESAYRTLQIWVSA